MNFFVLSAVFINLIVSITQSHSDTSTQQVTLSCPGMPEEDLRGPPGVPGKRGSKGEFGSPGLWKLVYNIARVISEQKKYIFR